MIESTSYGHDIKPGSERSFAFVFAAIAAVVGGYGMAAGRSASWIWLASAAGLVVIGCFAPRWLAPLNRLWFRLGLLLARVVQPLVVGAVFFAVVTPIGVLVRMTGKDVLRLRLDPGADTYWIDRVPPGPAPRTMTRQF